MKLPPALHKIQAQNTNKIRQKRHTFPEDETTWVYFLFIEPIFPDEIDVKVPQLLIQILRKSMPNAISNRKIKKILQIA